MSFNKLYDMKLEHKSQNRSEKWNEPISHRYTKTTLCQIIAVAVIVAAIMSAGSGIVVYLMMSREIECKLVMPESLPTTSHSYVAKTTEYMKLFNVATRESRGTTTRYVSSEEKNTTTPTTSAESEDERIIKISTESIPASTKIKVFSTDNSATETTAPEYFSENSTKNKFTEETASISTRSMVTDGRTTIQQAKEMVCPTGWLTHASSCYHFSNDRKNWTEALAVCKTFSGWLVEIYDIETDTVLRTKAKALNSDFWIGLADLRIEGTWVWTGSNTNVTAEMYTNWAPRQPDDGRGSEDCALIERIYSFLWNDDQCYNLHRYICEKKLS